MIIKTLTLNNENAPIAKCSNVLNWYIGYIC